MVQISYMTDYYINVSSECPSTFSGLRQDFFLLRFGLKHFELTLYSENFSCFITSGLCCSSIARQTFLFYNRSCRKDRS